MLTKDKIVQTIQQHADDLSAYGVRKTGVFGSFTRPSQNPRGDTDVLVEFKRGNKTFDSYIELKFYLERLFRRKIDLVIKGTLKARIKNRVLSEVEYA